MDFDFGLKIVSTLLAVVGAARIMYELAMGRHHRMRDEYRFARDFLTAIKEEPDMHPFVREKGYHAIAGDRSIGSEAIEYLISLQRPERALKDYVLGRSYIEHLPSSGNLQIEFRPKYYTSFSRTWRKWTYGVLYFVLAFVAFVPLVFSGVLGLALGQTVLLFLLCLVTFGSCSFLALKEAASIYRAEMLVSHQDKHVQQIIVQSGARIHVARGERGPS
ncbi:hypothetical protein [Massilia endophytica]|uniref:hypothetical protein n=1 Tax=Massilia endophytica TaxID=2899220 RepID=UPI001E2D31B3|nr:hypothetical protein [Massilia endophytica]UGQ44798.1 hypothetical protein LSQ66_13410 [Massilia endophytica]